MITPARASGDKTEPARSVFIPLQPLSENRKERMHWAARRRHTASWASWIPPLVLSQKATRPAEVRITRYFSGRGKARDMDNLVGGLKPILDLFSQAGYLVDDSPAWVQTEYRQGKAVKDPGPGVLFEFWYL